MSRGRASLAALIAVAGCTSPITNELFYADEAFLAALPGEARFGPPMDLRLARVGGSEVLTAAVGAAAELESLDASLRASGEALRTTVPSVRTRTERSWSSTSTSARMFDETRLWWVRGSVARPSEDADLDWTIEASANGASGWEEVGGGRHTPPGRGEVWWDLDRLFELVELDKRPGTLDIEYDDLGVEGVQRAVKVEFADPGLGFAQEWTVGAEAVLIWNTFFQLTADDQIWPGSAQAFQNVEGGGGWGSGVVLQAGTELAWESCWNDNGDAVYSWGERDFDLLGVPEDCDYPNPLD